MIYLIGKKMGMTSVYNDGGERVPVTMIELGPCTVVQVKTQDKDGYEAVQIGFGKKNKKNISKPLAGHLAKANLDSTVKLSEFRVEKADEYEVGQIISAGDLSPNQQVNVIGVTKGRGFAGGMKRYGFKGHRASHGEEKHHRTNGSLASSARLTHVWKGKRMSGHMGNVRETVRNLDIVKVDAENNMILVKGSIPGFSGSLVTVIQG